MSKDLVSEALESIPGSDVVHLTSTTENGPLAGGLNLSPAKGDRSTNLFHHGESLLPIHFRIYFGHDRRAMSEDHASHVEAEFPP